MTDGFETRRPPRSAWPGRLCFACVFIGIILVLVSLALTLRSRSWVKTALRTQGTIVAIAPAPRSGNDAQTFYPVYEAIAADGRTFKVTGNVGSSPPPTIGARAVLAYPLGKPGDALVVGILGIWFVPIVVGSIGIVWTMVGLTILLIASHPGRAAAKA